MSDFLLELRSEEIPARMQAGAREALEKLFRKEMDAAGVSLGEITVWSTPRRLALIARGLPIATAAVSEELKGPRVGAPPQALEGFLRKTGLSEDQLTERDGVLYAVTEKPGRATAEVLAEAIPAIIRAFPWPKSQRWGAASLSSESLRWVRPLSAIVALFDGAVVDCEVGGVSAGRLTRGHRFHSDGEISIDGVGDYAAKLRAEHVIVDHAEREGLIRTGVTNLFDGMGLEVIADEGLVIENAGLTEWPMPLPGGFDEAFLAVPPEVIQLSARLNQKYFMARDAGGDLAPVFACVANVAATDAGKAISAGNEKVLAARLSDARFFWEQDRKKTLAQHAEGLARITFHEKLGTVADKAERVGKLAEWLASEGIVSNCDPALARQAAQLCKADLVTEMVGEFPELQGLMGGYYARAEGLPDAVADAIRDHYKPVGQGDDVPTAPVTVAVSLADKLDSIIQFFDKGIRPTGSKDPFALRRAALGIVSLVIENGLRVPLRDVFAMQPLQSTLGVSLYETRDFFVERLKVQQREAGVRHDLIDSVFALGDTEFDLVRLLARVHALQAFIGTEDGTNLLAGYKRAANILKKEGVVPAQAGTAGSADAGLLQGGQRSRVEPGTTNALSYTPETAENALIDALAAAAPKASAAVAAEDFAGAMAALATLRAPIDAFFDEVTVNDADDQKRAFRLGLLASFRDAVYGVADFSRIEG